MKDRQGKLNTIGGFILHSGINCLVASGNPASIIAELVKGITTNLASNHAATLGNYSFEKPAARRTAAGLNKAEPELERLFRQAAVVALQYIKVLFLSEIEKEERVTGLSKEERKTFLKALTLFFDENIEDLRNAMKNEVAVKLDTSLIKEPQAFLENTTEQIFRMSSVSFDPVTEGSLKAFYAGKLPYCFELAFKEVLKNDDRGFKAFQIWVLEDLRGQNLQLLEGQTEILEAIRNISNGGNLISQQQLDDILNGQTERIYTLLAGDFKRLRLGFEETTVEIRKDFSRLYQLNVEHYELSKQSYTLQERMLALLKTILEKLNIGKTSLAHELNLVPRHTDEFIGRETEMEELEEKLAQSDKMVLLNGIGGIGKTTLAKKYVQRYSNKYNYIAWIDIKLSDGQVSEAASRDAFINAFANDSLLWKALFSKDLDEKILPEDRFKDVILALKNTEGTSLLVIDNAGEEIKEFREGLPAPPRWQVLVTSRQAALTGFSPFPLHKLEKDKAIELFRTWHGAESKDIEALLEEVDYHTLMIEMLAKTLEASMRTLTIQEMTEKLKTGHLDDADLQERIETSHSKAETELFRHLFITFQLAGLTEAETGVLKKLYFLLPQGYSLTTLISWFQIQSEAEKSFRNTLKKLSEKGWLSREGDTFSMHRLIQQVVYYKLNPAFADAEALMAKFTRLTYFDAYTDKASLYQYIPYIEYITDRMPRNDRSNDLYAGLLNNLSLLYSDIQQYGKAQEAYLEALQTYRKLTADNPVAFEPAVATTLNNLGNLYSNIRQHGKAEESYLKALQTYRKLAADNAAAFEPDVAMTLNNLGALYRNIQQYEKAEKVYLEALQTYRKLATDNAAAFEPDVAMTLNNLGNLYSSIQQHGKAEDAFLEALQTYRKLATGNAAAFEPSVATTLNNLGNLYSNIQQYGKAEEAYFEALQVRRRLAADNPAAFELAVATTLNNLGVLYRNIQQYGKAEEAYLEALQIRRKYLSAQPHTWKEVVKLYLLLADTYKKLDRKDDLLSHVKSGMVILLFFCQSQDEANSYINYARELVETCGLDFNQFWKEDILPEFERLRSENSWISAI